MAIEHVLAEMSEPRAEGLPRYFNALQDTFQCNGAPSCVLCSFYLQPVTFSVIPYNWMDCRHDFAAREILEQELN